VSFKKLVMAAAFYGRFAASFTQIGYAARRLFWSPYPNEFHGQHWLVTGGSGGLGREMVIRALHGGARVTAAARSTPRLESLARAVTAQGLSGLAVETCDFTLMADTHRLIERLAAAQRPVDVLVNNVGVLNDGLVITPEGLEASFASNLLSHFVLTEGLLGRGLLHSGSIVVNVTSGGGYTVPLVNAALNVTDTLRFNGVLAYGMHKRAQMVLNQYWRERYEASGIGFYVMHPGWADTAGVQRSLPRFRHAMKWVLRDAHSGVDTALWLAATRPRQPQGELVWFDRKIRPAHVYAHTRQSRETPQSLVDFLRTEVQRLAGSGVDSFL